MALITFALDGAMLDRAMPGLDRLRAGGHQLVVIADCARATSKQHLACPRAPRRRRISAFLKLWRHTTAPTPA